MAGRRAASPASEEQSVKALASLRQADVSGQHCWDAQPGDLQGRRGVVLFPKGLEEARKEA